MAKPPKLYLWLLRLTQETDQGYDCMHGCVIAACAEDVARRLATVAGMDEVWGKHGGRMQPGDPESPWNDPGRSSCTRIGVADAALSAWSPLILTDVMNG